jgi:hypothetical protein
VVMAEVVIPAFSRLLPFSWHFAPCREIFFFPLMRTFRLANKDPQLVFVLQATIFLYNGIK